MKRSGNVDDPPDVPKRVRAKHSQTDDDDALRARARSALTPDEIEALAECLVVKLVPQILRAIAATNGNAELLPAPRRRAQAAVSAAAPDIHVPEAKRQQILRKLREKGIIADDDE